MNKKWTNKTRPHLIVAALSNTLEENSGGSFSYKVNLALLLE